MADGCAPFYYELKQDGSMSILQYRKGPFTFANTYDDYPLSFPRAAADLVELNPEVQDLIRRINNDAPVAATEEVVDLWSVPRHQIGVEPYLLQQNPDYEMICPLCADVMPFSQTSATIA